MTPFLRLLARAADRLLGRPHVSMAARLAAWTLNSPGPAVPSSAGPGDTSPTTRSNLKERT